MRNLSIILRNGSKIYRRLNYQWQLKGPHKELVAFVTVRSERYVVTVVRCGTKEKVRVIAKGGGHNLEKYVFGNQQLSVGIINQLVKGKNFCRKSN